jgi:hypothetical protein
MVLIVIGRLLVALFNFKTFTIILMKFIMNYLNFNYHLSHFNYRMKLQNDYRFESFISLINMLNQ